MLGETMKTLFSDKENVRILDAGAGTGLTAEQVGTSLKTLAFDHFQLAASGG